MPAFAVLEPPGDGKTPLSRADRFIFLREKFSASAFLFGPLWMVWQRLWLELVAYLAMLAAVGSALYALSVGWSAIILIFGLIQLLLGLEATNLVRWKRERYGWRDGGIVIADDLDLAERRYFGDRFARRAAKPPAASAATLPPPPPGASTGPGVIGLFPEPGGGR